MKYYVTMTDKFMSGWGMANNRINKLIFPCESYKQAVTVANNARARSDQIYINIRCTKPRYDKARYYAQVMTIKECPAWYDQGYFVEDRP